MSPMAVVLTCLDRSGNPAKAVSQPFAVTVGAKIRVGEKLAPGEQDVIERVGPELVLLDRIRVILRHLNHVVMRFLYSIDATRLQSIN